MKQSEWLNERFIESFEKRFKRLPKETRKSIQNELTKIHFKLLHYTLNKSDEFPLDISFFNQNYPTFYCYLLEYMNDLMSKHKSCFKINFFLFSVIYCY